MRHVIHAFVIACLMQTSPALVRSVSAADEIVNGAGSFARLSTSDQKIARALFNAQIATENGTAPMSLDQIAAARRELSWAQLFRNMRSQGLIFEETLKRVVNRPAATALFARRNLGTDAIVTDGSGEVFIGRGGWAETGIAVKASGREVRILAPAGTRSHP